MKITKQRLKEIIREELLTEQVAPGLGKDVRFTAVESRDDAMRGADRPGAGIEDIAAVEDEETRDRAFGSPEEKLITLINARDVLNKMTPADLEALSLSLDAPMVATLRHILANPMYAPMGGQGHSQDHEMELEEGWGQGDTAYQQATQLLGKHAQMHGLRNQVADALRQKRVSPQQVQKAAQGASSSYHVAQRLGLK